MVSTMFKIRNVRSVVSVLLAMLLSFCLTFLFFLFGWYYGLFRTDFVMKDVRKSNYYEKNYEAYLRDVASFLDGLDMQITEFEEMIPYSLFYASQREYIQGALNGKEHKMEHDEMNQTIHAYLHQSIQKQNIVINQELDEKLDEITEMIQEKYRTQIEEITFQNLYKQKIRIKRWMLVFIPVGCAVTICLCAMLCAFYKRKYRAMRYIVSAFIASIGELYLVCIMVEDIRAGHSYQMQSDYLRDFMEIYFERSCNFLFQIGAGVALVCILAFILMIRVLKSVYE